MAGADLHSREAKRAVVTLRAPDAHNAAVPTDRCGMSDAFLEHLRELFSGVGSVEPRPMFGGHGLYLEGTIVGIVLDETLYLKTDAATRPRFEAAGCTPCVYDMKGRPLTMSYWTVPAEALDSPEALRPWAELAHAAALRKPAGRRRR